MALTQLTYQPSINGAIITNALFTGSKITKRNVSSITINQWKKVLNLLYNDFIITLGPALDIYILQATSVFVGSGTSPIIKTPLVLTTFKTKPSKTAKIIYNNIFNHYNNIPANQQSIIVWKTFFNAVFTDICDIIPNAICSSINMSTTMALPGALAPTPLVSPIPCTITINFQPAQLKILLQQYYNSATAQQIAQTITQKIYAKTKKMPARQASSFIWDTIIKQLQIGINTKLSIYVKQFLTNGVHYKIPSGAPCSTPDGVKPLGGVITGRLV